MLSTLLFSLVMVIAVVVQSISHAKNHWIFLRYHKTGNYISRRFAMVFKNECNSTIKEIREDISKEFLENSLKSDIFLVSRERFHTPWKDAFNIFGHNYKIIHIVRDPYDVVVSGLLYHSQEHNREKFLKKKYYPLCNYNIPEILRRYVPILAPLRDKINADGSKVNGTEVITAQILAAAQLCHELWQPATRRIDYRGNTSCSYFLRHANKSNIPNLAIRVEAIRALLPAMNEIETGDLLYMASNAMFEDKSVSKRIFTSEFPADNREQWINTTTNMYEFLLKDTEMDRNDSFRRCKTISEVVEKSVEYNFRIEGPKLDSKHEIEYHVTTGMITPEQKELYISVLKNDPILSPLLNLVADALKIYAT